ncbi:MAG: inositol monophosphatase family protein [Paludibacter sp.]|jgi:myo-inositol-1(or 4)-monophosphatase|nr:inositol monophosphatase family protein [Paludibacter sp.]
MEDTYKKLCLQTCEIARTSGKIMAEERKSFDASKIENKGMHDLVSYVDKESEKRIIAELQKLLPESGFIAEEGTNDTRGERFNWVIDPLDGTTNFIQGVPIYCVSIGLLDGDELVVGVVYEVGRDECFYAWKDGGAFLNGEKISVSDRRDIHDALLATGFPYSDFSRIEEYIEFLKWAMKNARGVRRLGSAAADLAYVACGRFDAFWEYDLKPWDVAAGALLVKEAGGMVSDYSGDSNYLFDREIIASNSLINGIVLDKIKENLKY